MPRKQGEHIFALPLNEDAEQFLKLARKYLVEGYVLKRMWRGPRRKTMRGMPPGLDYGNNTLKKDAKYCVIYLYKKEYKGSNYIYRVIIGNDPNPRKRLKKEA